jgi:hypothetical protein
VGFFVGIYCVNRFKITLDINVFQVVDYADMAVARNALVIRTEISLDATALTAGFHD